MLEHVAAKWKQYWSNRKAAKTPLLDDYSFVYAYPAEVRRIARKRRRCTLNGHMFALTEIIDGHNYTVTCQRCFPHIDSQHVIVSYNPFERKTD